MMSRGMRGGGGLSAEDVKCFDLFEESVLVFGLGGVGVGVEGSAMQRGSLSPPVHIEKSIFYRPPLTQSQMFSL